VGPASVALEGRPVFDTFTTGGNGRAFSAGADRSLLDNTSTAAEMASAGEEFDELLEVLRDCEKPLLAAVNGLAVGFGCTMMLYFDLLLAAESARFRLPFTALGLLPEAGSSVLLPARVPWDEAIWALLSSERLSASKAREIGLIWRVVPDLALIAETSKVSDALAALDPASVRATKRLLTAGRADAARLAADRELIEMAKLRTI
jgi:enoyl-CoA hydratase/carnithine racemase